MTLEFIGGSRILPDLVKILIGEVNEYQKLHLCQTKLGFNFFGFLVNSALNSPNASL